MGNSTSNFVERFHALEGDLIGERKKNFSKLLRDVNAVHNKELIDDFLKNLRPKTYLESLLKIDALIYFRKTPELLDILKEGNEVFISKIIKQSWFFEEAFEDVDAEQIVNEFLPSISFKFRIKVLKQISFILEEEETDQVFSLVYNRYGLWIARNILHTCSAEHIMKVLKDENIYLRPNQVEHLFDRNTDLFIEYLDYYKETTSNPYNETKVLHSIAIKDPDLIIDLEINNQIDVRRLGRRTSKRVFDIVKDDIPENINTYKSFVNNAVIIRKLGKEFESIYAYMFPKKISDIRMYSECITLLRYYPKNKRWPLFSQTALANFNNKDLTEIFKIFSESILGLNPDKNIMYEWAETRYSASNTDHDDLIKYMDPKKAIPLLKEKINVTSRLYMREYLVDLLLETCAQNEDLNMLEEILKYICVRHRNERVSFHREILDRIRDLFKLQDLNENHWKCINELIELLRIRNEFQLYRQIIFLQRYLEYLCKNCKDYKTVLIQYINDMARDNHCHKLDLQNPAIERQIYMEITKIAPGIIKNGNAFQISLVQCLISFNEENPAYFINFAECKYISEYIHCLFDKTDDFEGAECNLIDDILHYRMKFPRNAIPDDDSKVLQTIFSVTMKHNNYLSAITKMVAKTARTDFENELLGMYFKNIFDKHPNTEIVSWFLANEPRILIPYFNKIIKSINFNLNILKLYSHFNFDEKLIEFYKTQLHSKETVGKANLMRDLAILLPTDDFASIVNELFLPTKHKIDFEDEKMKEVYKVQCDVARELHKVIEPAKMLPVILKFCVGDYFQHSLRALYSLFHRSPENQLYPYIDTLSKRAVSIRKHSVFLTCDILEHKRVLNILTTTKHSDVSSQRHLFSAASKYFQKNPSQQLLNLVISNMRTIDKNDTEILRNLIYSRVPKKYKPLYIEKCWGFYESLGESLKTHDYLWELWQIVMKDSEIIAELSSSFIKNILENYFGNPAKKLSDSNEFAISVLNLREWERMENFELLFKKVAALSPGDVESFFNYFTNQDLDAEFVELFAKYWSDYFTKVKTFNQHIFLNLLSIHFANSSAEDFVANVILYVEKLILEYSPYVYDTIKYVFNDFLEKKRNDEKYNIYYHIVKLRKTQFFCLLVLDLLEPVRDEEDEHSNKIHQNIMEILRNTKEPIVNIYYEKYVCRTQ